jgi:hypothetical protein
MVVGFTTTCAIKISEVEQQLLFLLLSWHMFEQNSLFDQHQME